MLSFINTYIGYIAIAIVLGIGALIWHQSSEIDSLQHDLNDQKILITNQKNEINSLKTDVAGFQKIDRSRSDNRTELQGLKDKIGRITEADLKNDPSSEIKLKETVNTLLNDISEVTK